MPNSLMIDKRLVLFPTRDVCVPVPFLRERDAYIFVR